MAERVKVIDVREVPPMYRHSMIFETFDSLAPGETMQLVNDHDPKPLYYQFQAELAGRFEWEYEVTGPEEWRVNIKKVEAGAAD